MGLLDKLFSRKNDAVDMLKDISKYINQEASTATQNPRQTTQPQNIHSAAVQQKTPQGQSWGPTMPEEENQYSYHGSYEQYFEDIFQSSFSQYSLTKENIQNRTVYTFMKDANKCLVIELVSRKSNPQKIRCDCAKLHIPYLRFYYDYHGWWNTRSYVINRTNNALR
ncbi:MAG: hypothetical protein MJ071_03855 [Oscillospiraceae bacterium]|nr:hypothetical protein [Oscillospiraceae bacterium]